MLRPFTARTTCVSLVTALLAGPVAAIATAQSDAAADPATNNNEQLGYALKQASASGVISDDDAMAVWTLLTEPEPGSPEALARQQKMMARINAAVQRGDMSPEDAENKRAWVRAESARTGFTNARFDREPVIHVRHLPIIAHVFDLDDDEAAITEALLQGHQVWLHDAATTAEQQQRELVQASRTDMIARGFDWARLQSRLDAIESDFRLDRVEHEAELILDLRTLYTDEDWSRWSIVERDIRRERTLKRGRLSGERTDLTLLADDLDVDRPNNPALTDTLDRYADELDRALVARDAFLDAPFERGDPDAGLERVTREMQLRAAVRGVNERYVEIVATVLDPSLRDRWRMSYQRDAYPQVYRATTTDDAFESAEAMELEASVRSRVDDLEQKFVREMSERNAEIARLLRDRETTRPVEIAQMKRDAKDGDWGKGQPSARRAVDPLDLAYRRKEESVLMYRRMLDAMIEGM